MNPLDSTAANRCDTDAWMTLRWTRGTRYYRVHLEQDLWNHWLLTLVHGRRGTPLGRSRVVPAPSFDAALRIVAAVVRRLLISLNVDPERIRLFYRGAGNFVANNSTPEGKAMNRRVEIELRKW
jgi:hypothetical protein